MSRKTIYKFRARLEKGGIEALQEAQADLGGDDVSFDRSGYTDVGVDAPLDCADPATWACRPDATPNECEVNLDATEVLADGTFALDAHEVAAEPAFDCFYVMDVADAFDHCGRLQPADGRSAEGRRVAGGREIARHLTMQYVAPPPGHAARRVVPRGCRWSSRRRRSR